MYRQCALPQTFGVKLEVLCFAAQKHRTMPGPMNGTNQLRNTLRPQLEKGMTRRGGDLSDDWLKEKWPLTGSLYSAPYRPLTGDSWATLGPLTGPSPALSLS